MSAIPALAPTLRLTRLLPAAMLALLLAMFATLAGARSASAAGVVGTGTPASCTDAAFAAAAVGGGLVTFNCGAAPHTIIINTRVVDNGLTVDGGNRIVLDGEDLRQPFFVLGGGDLVLRNIELTRSRSSLGAAVFVSTNGEARLSNVTISLSRAEGLTGGGGAIYNQGDLTLINSRIISNVADFRGGGLFNAGGVVSIDQTSFHNNGAYDGTVATVATGGAIYQSGGNLTVTRSSITNNAAELQGGGLYIAGGTLLLNRSVVAANSANSVVSTDGGGIVTAAGTVNLNNSSVVYNKADSGGGIYNVGATVTLRNSIVADNYAPLSVDPTTVLDCDGPTLLTLGFNIIGDGSCLIGPDASDRKDTSP
ncbi:MAG: right-handed parallel beta-helix repeat-containing protein, partial [Caldilineaceae bacterium]